MRLQNGFMSVFHLAPSSLMSALHLAFFFFVSNFHTLWKYLVVLVNKVYIEELVALVKIHDIFLSPLQEWITVDN